MKPKLLLVEDDDVGRAGLSRVLAILFPDSTVIEAKDGAEGLSLAKSEKPDLVISDVQMPALDGIELVNALRREKIRTRVILMTAYADKIVYQVTKLGVSCVLEKPFKVDQLNAAIKRALVYDSPLSLYSNEPEMIQEIIAENSELKDKLELQLTEATELREQVRKLSHQNFELRLASDRKLEIEKHLETQAQEIASLQNRLRASTRRERFELAGLRIISLAVVIGGTVLLKSYAGLDGGYPVYIFPALLLLLILLPFDRIKSLAGKFKKTEVHAEFLSESESNDNKLNSSQREHT